ncbi:hypothetical protein D3C76_915190 [compost metagenome]
MGALQAYLPLVGNDRHAHEAPKAFLQRAQADIRQPGQVRTADQVFGVILNVLDGQLHMSRCNERGRAPKGFGKIVRPGFQHGINQHFSKA